MANKTPNLPASKMGHCKMTRRLRMSISQKLASWKGSAKDAKAGKKPLCPLWLFSLFLCAFLWLKNPCNPCNPWLMNYLHAFGIFTLVKKSLQINLFMQNKPKFRKVKFNVNKVLTTDYDIMDTWSIGKNEPKRTQNEPKTNPNKPNFKGKKICLDAPKILTITNMAANLKKCTVFPLFIERTLFGR